MNEPDTARLATQRGPNADASPRRRVLLVEDEASIREVLSQYLALEGFAIIGVADGTEALRMAQSAPPDLVILALMLPSVDGLEVCRRLWASSAVPILMLTARGEATFIGPKILDVRLASGETRSLTADTIVINTGARPSLTPVPGLESIPVLDSTSIRSWTSCLSTRSSLAAATSRSSSAGCSAASAAV